MTPRMGALAKKAATGEQHEFPNNLVPLFRLGIKRSFGGLAFVDHSSSLYVHSPPLLLVHSMMLLWNYRRILMTIFSSFTDPSSSSHLLPPTDSNQLVPYLIQNVHYLLAAITRSSFQKLAEDMSFLG